MRIPKPIKSLQREDGSIKEILTSAYTPKNFRRIFPNQTFPLLSLFANKPTQILVYLMANADSNNMIYATYKSIMEDCQVTDKKTVTRVLKDLQEAHAIVEVSTSHYMLNPAVMLPGNDQKFGLLAAQFNDFLSAKSIKKQKESATGGIINVGRR